MAGDMFIYLKLFTFYKSPDNKCDDKLKQLYKAPQQKHHYVLK